MIQRVLMAGVLLLGLGLALLLAFWNVSTSDPALAVQDAQAPLSPEVVEVSSELEGLAEPRSSEEELAEGQGEQRDRRRATGTGARTLKVLRRGQGSLEPSVVVSWCPAGDLAGERGARPTWGQKRSHPQAAIANPVGGDGTIELPDGENGDLAVWAEDGQGRRGSRWVGADLRGDLTLEIGYRTEVKVLVVDGRGVPQEGIRVGILDQQTWGPRLQREGRTDAQGRAALSLDAGPGGQQPFPRKVALLGAYDPAVSVPLAEEAGPGFEEPVQLVLPDCAAIEVSVKGGDGTLLQGSEVFVVSRAAFDASFANARESSKLAGDRGMTVNGVVRFERVMPAADVVVVAYEVGGSGKLVERQTAPGPGQTARMELAFDSRDVVLEGILEADPEEFKHSWNVAMVDPQSAHGWRSAQSRSFQPEEDGRFRLRLEREFLKNASEFVCLALGSGGSLRAMVPLEGRLSPGVHDVGLLPAGPGAVVAAGRLVDEGGQGLANTTINLQCRAPEGSWMNPSIGSWGRSKSSGAFSFEGRVLPTLEWRLQPDKAVTELIGPQTIRPGDQDIELLVSRKATANGRLLVPDEVREWHGFMNLLRLTLHESGSKAWKGSSRPDRQGNFVLKNVPKPTYDLHVTTSWHTRPLEIVADLTPPRLDSEPDPRLQIDLRDRLKLVRLRALDPEGQPILGAYAQPVEDGPPDFRRTNNETVTVLLFDRPSMNLRIGAAGYREVVIENVKDDLEVTLSPALEVSLEWGAMPELSSTQRLVPVPHPVGKEDVRSLHNEMPPGFNSEGIARIKVPAPGRYEVHLQIEGVYENMRSTSVMKIEVPTVIEVVESASEQHFEVSFDLEKVKQRLGLP